MNSKQNKRTGRRVLFEISVGFSWSVLREWSVFKMDCVNSGERCFICGKDVPVLIAVGEKGKQKLELTSIERDDGNITFLNKSAKICVHVDCRRNYTHPHNIKSAKKNATTASAKKYSPVKKKLRFSDPPFDWQKMCFICGKEADDSRSSRARRSLKRHKIHHVSQAGVQESILELVKNNQDDLSRSLLTRIANIPDLRSVHAKYHSTCYKDLFKGEHSEKVQVEEEQKSSIDEVMEQIFAYMERANDNLFSLGDLKSMVSLENLPDDKTIKKRLIERYGHELVVSSRAGKSTFFCFVQHHYTILENEWQNQRLKNESDEENRILQMAGKIIRKNIQSEEYSTELYPPSQQFFANVSDCIPKNLKFLLEEIIMTNKKGGQETMNSYQRKCISIGHAIITAVRPRSFLSSLQIGLAVSLHRKFGTKKIIDICNDLGFCASYNEARLYEISASFQSAFELLPGTAIQYVVDNSDFNVDTIDGKNTFHNLGRIAIISPENGLMPREPIKRLAKPASRTEIASSKKISLQDYPTLPGEGLKKIFLNLDDNASHPSLTSIRLLTFWSFLKFKRVSGVPGWNGFMEILTNGEDFITSKVLFLPFIYGKPSDYNTLFTSIKDCADNCQKVGLKTCIITADQPLYIKIRDIISSQTWPDNLLVVARLGQFHTDMSFLGSIGYIMSGSGLEQALGTVYGETVLKQIFSGKAYARAVRAHTLMQLALTKIVFSELMQENEEFAEIFRTVNFSESLSLYDIEDLTKMHEFERISTLFEAKLNELESRGRTSKLWVTYIRMCSILRANIAAERMGDWKSHLITTELMIPYFHAAGHFHYAKSTHLYVQDMKKFNKFTTLGHFTVRRTAKFFAGTSTDYAIEAGLMRSMNVQGGPFRRGASESVVHQWIEASINCQDIIEGMEEFCAVSSDTSLQHTDARDATVKRDDMDLAKIEDFLGAHNPFRQGPLMNIATGVTGDDKINCCDALEVGVQCMQKLDNVCFKDLKLSKKDKVMPLLTVNSKMKIHDEVVPIDPSLLFQRICVSRNFDTDVASFFKFELAPYPLSLFDEGGMRKTQKASFFELFSDIQNINLSQKKYSFVIDGGMLLHRVKWRQGQTFHSICTSYVDYLQRNYDGEVIVVFDGYKDDGVKSMERTRRTLKESCIDIVFSEEMSLTITQQKFLSNNRNKERLINMLGRYLSSFNISCCQADSDADRLIVTTAINQGHDVVIVSEDTDVLVLFTAVVKTNQKIFFSKPSKGQAAEKFYATNSFSLPKCKEHILFLHALTGCDTTSAFWNRGKNSFAKIFERRVDLQENAAIFQLENVDPKDLYAAGLKCILALYGAPKGTASLDDYRFINV